LLIGGIAALVLVWACWTGVVKNKWGWFAGGPRFLTYREREELKMKEAKRVAAAEQAKVEAEGQAAAPGQDDEDAKEPESHEMAVLPASTRT
jgi:hypothetical protein